MHLRAFEVFISCLAQDLAGFVVAIKTNKSYGEINVRPHIFRIQIDRRMTLTHRFFERAYQRVFVAQEVQRFAVPRIHSLPRLKLVDLRVPFTRNPTVIVRGNHKPLALADSIAQIVSAFMFFARFFELTVVGIAKRQTRMVNRKVRIKLDRFLIERNRVRVISFRVLLDTLRVLTQGFERGSCHLLDRRIEFLDRVE